MKFWYFPLIGHNADDFKAAKTPRRSFLEKYSSDPKTVEEWFSIVGMVGLRTGLCEEGNLIVLDIDEQRGGEDVLPLLNLPNAPTVKTPHGRHLYFRVPVDVRIGLDNHGKIGDGIDVRGEHGYVVAAGSHYKDLKYVALGEWPERFEDFPELPEEYISILEAPPKEEKGPDLFFGDEQTLASAKVLLESWEDVYSGNRGDSVYKMAGQLKDLGVPQEVTLEMIQQSVPANISGIGKRKIEETVKNTYLYGKRPAGCYNPRYEEELYLNDLLLEAPASAVNSEPKSSPEQDSRDVQQDAEKDSAEAGEGDGTEDTDHRGVDRERAALEKLAAKWKVKNAAEIVQPRDVKYLISCLIPEKSMCFLYGPPGAGKSFIAIDIAHRVASGLQWCGRKVEQCEVLYLAAEARLSIENRFLSVRARPDGGAIPRGLHYYPEPVSLKDRSVDMAVLRAILLLNPAIKFVVIDTVARSLDEDESDNQSVARFLRAIQRIIKETGITVMFVHHTGKDIHKGMRGSSNFLGFAETVLVTLPVFGEGKDAPVIGYCLSCEKQSEGPKIPDHNYRLVQVKLGNGSEGDITSCYVSYALEDSDIADMIEQANKQAIVAASQSSKFRGNGFELDDLLL